MKEKSKMFVSILVLVMSTLAGWMIFAHAASSR